MEMAVYQIYLDSKAATNKNALSLWLKDASVKFDDPAVAYINEEDIAAEMTIQLTMDTGEWYRYVIDKVEKEWHKYTIKFDDFTLNNGDTLFDKPNPLNVNHIIHMAFGFKYLYYDQLGNHHPTYAIANPVYIDEIYFTSAAQSSIVELPGSIKPDAGDSNKITIDTFDEYETDADMFDKWSYLKSFDYNEMTLSNDVSSIGGTKSNRMKYQGADSVSYSRVTQFVRGITAKGFSIDIKGDGKATVYLNLNWRSGSTLYKMRYTLLNVAASWTHYEIGFSKFKDINGTTKQITQNFAGGIESVSFGIVNSDKSQSYIYIDNVRLLRNIGYSDVNITTID
jgi:hypothetical protein